MRRAAATGATLRSVDVADTGFDLSAYAAAARELSHDRVCFLNSHSEVLADGWLAKLASGLDLPDVGVAGTTGSWESTVSLAARQAGLRNAYTDVFPSRDALMKMLHEMGGTRPRGTVPELLFAAKMAVVGAAHFPRFPAIHIRTNAFLIDRAIFAMLRMNSQRNKLDAYRFEGGRDGMTAQLKANGLKPIVVDRHGRQWCASQWAEPELFRQGRQADLLVADNQTRAYDAAPPAHRAVLSGCAWGPMARPA